ncbi:protein rep, partial [Sulfurimonas sp. MAG313]
EERYKHLKKSYKKLLNRRRVYLKNGRGYTELSKSLGGVHSFEFTNNQGKGWHPHVHSIVLLDKYIDQKALSEEWEKITGDSKIVDIRKITTGKDGTMIKGLLEVFKYALKFSTLELEDNYHAYQTLRGQRLQSAYGCLWGVKVPETDMEDPLTGLPYLELFYRYLDSSGYSLQELKKIVEI